MAKMQKLYRLNLEAAKTLNIAHFNTTCKAILKAMYRIEKQSAEADNFQGSTGEYILQFAVKNGLWFTRQVPEKYHTTWAFYVSKLKKEAGIVEVGTLKGLSTEEYLDSDDEFLDEPSDEDMEETEEEWSDDDLAVAKAEDDNQAAAEDAELARMIAEEEFQLQAAE